MDVRILLIPKRENPNRTKRPPLTSRGHTSQTHLEESQRGKHRETCRGNVDYRIPGIPHSTVQKEDPNCKEIVKRLIQQLENHPNRDSSTGDLNKTEEFNPFSEKSKELITSMGNTEYFELCETSSKTHCLGCALYWEARKKNAPGANACSRQKGIDSCTRQDTTSCQSPATLSKRIQPTVPDMDHLCGSACTTRHMIC